MPEFNSAPGLETMLSMQNALRQRDIQDQQMQQAQGLRDALQQSGGNLEGSLSALLKSGNIKGAQELAPLLKLKQEQDLRQQTIQGLKDMYAPAGAAPSASAASQGEWAQPSISTNPVDPTEARRQQLQKLSVLYSGNAALQTALQREMDNLDKGNRPMIQMLPIGNSQEQPHISQDNGKTWSPIPNSKPRPIFPPKDVQTPENIDKTAQAIADYKIAPLSSFAMSRPGGRDVMARVSELNPQYDAKNFVTAQRTRNAFAVGVEGRTVRSFNVAIDHLDTLNDAATALGNGDIKRFNQLAQRTAQETGSPIPTNFDAIKGIVAKEIVKSIVGNATAGGVTERQALESELSRSSSPEQLKGMISRYQTLMAGQLKGLKQQYEAGLGGSDFESKFLLPRSKDVLSRMQQNTGSPQGNRPPPPAGFTPL
jgi:hypothetical protein